MTEEPNDRQVYASVLDEQRIRCEHADWFLSGGNSYINLESAALQLRQTLELIPLGALVANRDWVEAVASAFDRKAPGEAKKLMERVNPDYWPMPGAPVAGPNTELGFERIADGFVTEDEWPSEWGYVSSLLHARNPFKGHPGQEAAHEHLTQLHARLRRLLDYHVLTLPAQDVAWIGILRDDSGQSRVLTLVRP
jgi:hypothetical protein